MKKCSLIILSLLLILCSCGQGASGPHSSSQERASSAGEAVSSSSEAEVNSSGGPVIFVREIEISSGSTSSQDAPASNPYADAPEEDPCYLNLTELYENGYYYDAALIRLIGEENYEQWRKDTPADLRNVYRLIEDFELTWETLEEKLYIDVYEKYLEYKPE